MFFNVLIFFSCIFTAVALKYEEQHPVKGTWLAVSPTKTPTSQPTFSVIEEAYVCFFMNITKPHSAIQANITCSSPGDLFCYLGENIQSAPSGNAYKLCNQQPSRIITSWETKNSSSYQSFLFLPNITRFDAPTLSRLNLTYSTVDQQFAFLSTTKTLTKYFLKTIPKSLSVVSCKLSKECKFSNCLIAKLYSYHIGSYEGSPWKESADKTELCGKVYSELFCYDYSNYNKKCAKSTKIYGVRYEYYSPQCDDDYIRYTMEPNNVVAVDPNIESYYKGQVYYYLPQYNDIVITYEGSCLYNGNATSANYFILVILASWIVACWLIIFLFPFPEAVEYQTKEYIAESFGKRFVKNTNFLTSIVERWTHIKLTGLKRPTIYWKVLTTVMDIALNLLFPLLSLFSSSLSSPQCFRCNTLMWGLSCAMVAHQAIICYSIIIVRFDLIYYTFIYPVSVITQVDNEEYRNKKISVFQFIQVIIVGFISAPVVYIPTMFMLLKTIFFNIIITSSRYFNILNDENNWLEREKEVFYDKIRSNYFSLYEHRQEELLKNIPVMDMIFPLDHPFATIPYRLLFEICCFIPFITISSEASCYNTQSFYDLLTHFCLVFLSILLSIVQFSWERTTSTTYDSVTVPSQNAVDLAVTGKSSNTYEIVKAKEELAL